MKSSRLAPKKLQALIREAAVERDVQITGRLPFLTEDQGDDELARLRALPLVFATAKQRRLIETLARERAVTVDLPKRLPVEAVDGEFKRLKALPKIPKGGGRGVRSHDPEH